MTEFDSGRLQDGAHDRRTDLEPRDVRALTEVMSVLPEGGDVYTVVGENAGGEYTVDLRAGRCTCPDAQYRLEDGEQCKHVRRAAYATGERPIPAWIDADAIDDHLGAHVGGGPCHVATDGGAEIVVAGDEGELLEDDADEDDVGGEPEADDGRPDECNCGEWNEGLGLACWPCYREGFETPASADSEDETETAAAEGDR
jgi:predicted nucleic acid-binding Zn finger protein